MSSLDQIPQRDRLLDTEKAVSFCSTWLHSTSAHNEKILLKHSNRPEVIGQSRIHQVGIGRGEVPLHSLISSQEFRTMNHSLASS